MFVLRHTLQDVLRPTHLPKTCKPCCEPLNPSAKPLDSLDPRKYALNPRPQNSRPMPYRSSKSWAVASCLFLPSTAAAAYHFFIFKFLRGDEADNRCCEFYSQFFMMIQALWQQRIRNPESNLKLSTKPFRHPCRLFPTHGHYRSYAHQTLNSARKVLKQTFSPQH